MSEHRIEVLAKICDAIASRKTSSTTESYTAKLLSGGTEHCAKKFGEEAIETIIAAISGKHEAIASEAADLLYHLLVLLESAGVKVENVMKELEQRQGKSGFAEKASRTKR